MTARPRTRDPLIDAPGELAVARVGLGYVGTLVEQGLSISFDRIFESRGEVMGELTVERAPEGHLLRAKFSASSRSDRDATARDLGGRSNNVVWRDVLETFCLRVLEAERTGQPFDQVGALPPLAELDWLLRPMLVRGEPTILFGAGDAGKSLFAAACAFMVRTGVQVIGGFAPARPGAEVLVIDWEDQRQQWNDRIAAIAKAAGVEPPQIGYRRGMGVPLTDQLHDLAQHVEQQHVALLIVDSVGLAMPARSDGADANEAALRLFSALRHLSVTTLLIDHIAGADVGQEKLATKPYGSVYKAWMARSVWQLRAGSTTPDGVLHVGLWHTKFNAGPKHASLGLGIHFGPGEILIAREEIEDEELNAAMPLHSRIYNALLMGGKTSAQLAALLDEPGNKVRAVLGRMLDRQMAAQLEGRGRDKVWVVVTGREPAASVGRTSTAQHVEQQVLRSVESQREEDDPWG